MAISWADELTRLVVPSHPVLKPHDRLIHHFRHVLPLVPTTDDGTSLMHYYDSAIQLARNSSKELTEDEFEIGMDAAISIKKRCVHIRIHFRCSIDFLA